MLVSTLSFPSDGAFDRILALANRSNIFAPFDRCATSLGLELVCLNQTMALRYGQNLQVQNEQYERHTNKTKIGHEISKQQKVKRTT